jgi:hypothetical protein
MSRRRRSERALRKDVDRLARSKVQTPVPADRVIVPFSFESSGPKVVPESKAVARPAEHRSERVGAGVHIVSPDQEQDGVPHAS